MIYVTPMSRLEETMARSGARHLVTLMRRDSGFVRPSCVLADQHLMLEMHDIVEKMEGLEPPSQEHVGALIGFARQWDPAAPLVINCYAGISRSTAAAYVVAAALAPERNEAKLARELRRLSPSATPNRLVVALADALLGRQGRMIAAIEAIGRGADAFEGEPFVLPIG